MKRGFQIFLLLFFSQAAFSGEQPSANAIASAHPIATVVGHRILEAGGNAFDAAVAVSAVLAVVEPYSSGIGGGGFWLLHRVSDGKDVMIDGRESAPLAAHRELYLDESGNVIPGLSVDGALAAGIPGEPAALVHIAEKYGRFPLSKSLAPAIQVARDGFKVDHHYQRMAGFRLKLLQQFPETSRRLLKEGEVPPLGHIIRQPELAATLQAIADKGYSGFYAGPVAKKLVKGVRKQGGIWSLKDLEQYKIVEREPVSITYKSATITSAALPSSGGIVLATMLNILSGYDLENLDEVTRKHLIIEAMRRAYRDRAEYLGDSDFVDVPVKRLTDPGYANALRSTIQSDKATPSKELSVATVKAGGADTTHFSILDKEGNRVAATLSINYPFGSGFMPEGTGVLLNDEMDDFSSKPGSPNVYGLVGAEANAIAPGKRMLSSMSPTFIETEQGIAIVGTPGGSRIITMVLLAILEYLDGSDVQSMVNLPRFHHQYLPDVVQLEPDSLSDSEQQALRKKGHKLRLLENTYGNMHAIIWDKKKNRVQAASDPRGTGLAQVR
ncbi:MAG: gamma-glutamyltransferase [Gammaproteobacteria bacterium]|nr:gamma-glutamyltransferase [Gammaproteobacteria bacterium]